MVWILEERTLKSFWRRHPDSRGPLVSWIREVERARWQIPAEIRARFASASFVGDKVIFNVGGNKYRLIVRFRYADRKRQPPAGGIALVLFVGTHREYDDVDVAAL